MSKKAPDPDFFTELVKNTYLNEEKKLQQLKTVNQLLKDGALGKHLLNRQKFIDYYKTVLSLINSENLDKYQKEFYLHLDSLRKEALQLMSRYQQNWFNKLMQNHFASLKILLRNLLIGARQSDLETMERIIQEIELLYHREVRGDS